MHCSITTKIFTALLLLFTSFLSVSQTVVIGAQKSDIKNLTLWLAGKPCTEITEYNHPLAYRSVTELLFLCKALHLGGLNPTIEYREMPSYNRALEETRRGNITVHSDTAWLSTISEEYYYISQPFFKKNAFTKGLFVVPTEREAIEAKINSNLKKGISIKETIQSYIFTSSSGWVVDWAFIQTLKTKTINTPKQRTMCTLVVNRRADIMLAELTMINRTGFPFECNDVDLVPIRGFKVSFNDSRHFVVSKNYPESDKIYNALEKGLTILAQTGEIELAMYPIKSNRDTIKHWVDIGSAP